MTEALLRVLLLVFCIVGVSVLLQIAWWTVAPWVPYIGTSDRSVAVEPVGFIESGKLQTLQGSPAARSLSHRLQSITAALQRDLTEEYAVVQRHLNVSLPEASAPATTKFDPVISEPVVFEAKLFNLDVVGIGNFFYRQLYSGDTARVLVELAESKSRYFIEVTRPGQQAGNRSNHIDRSIKGDLHDVLKHAACDIAFLYHGGAARFSGMSAEAFCDFLDALGEYQSFVIETATAAKRGEPIAPVRLDRVITTFEREILSNSQAAIVHALRASLYKLRGDLAKAIETLEKAQGLSPGDRFIAENLPKWKEEQGKRVAVRPPMDPLRVDPAKVKDAYAGIRGQQALQQINYDALIRNVAKTKSQPIIVSILSTGYTPTTAPADTGPAILPVENLVAGESPEDGNGHGTAIVNLIAALIPQREIQLLPIKVLSDSGAGSTSNIVAGFNRSLERGARIIVAPLGGVAPSKIWDSVMASVEAQGALTFAAAGNSAQRPRSVGKVEYPAAAEHALAVGAVAADGTYASYSPGPKRVDVFAPGDNIAVIDDRGQLHRQSGTSFSTAIAAAVVAAAIAPLPKLSNESIRAALKSSGVPAVEGGPPVLDANRLWQTLSNAGKLGP